MSRADPTTNISNWNTHVAGMQQSSAEFYREVERLIGVHHLKDVKQERVDIKEGGIFSSKREYLQVRRDEFVFHVCAAPYGNGFFISWWFGSDTLARKQIRHAAFRSLAIAARQRFRH